MIRRRTVPFRLVRALSLAGALPLLAAGGAACRAQAPAAWVSAAPAGAGWSFAPPTDAFAPGALFDLRSLNETTAGEHGFITRTADGDFARGDGKPIRFWAVDEYAQDKDDDSLLAHKARWLAKRGVNMVRVHTQIAPGDGSELTDADQKAIGRVWRLVAAMKKEGIYTTISPYWGVHVRAQPKWAIPGMTGQELPAVLFYDPTLQRGYRAWLKALYAPTNPHTGVPLARDPAVAIIQLQNEDSLLFWTVQQLKGEQLTELQTLYGKWLANKYGSLDAANRAWGGDHPVPGDFQESQGDDFARGRAGIYIVWHLTQPQQPGYRQKRLSDQLAFLTDTMRTFNGAMTSYLRGDLGCRQLVNAGNWRPADPVKLMDAERVSYLPTDVMGVNRYVNGEHDGPDNGWAIRPGDRFTNASVLLDPRGMPTNVKQPVGYPFIVPETEWVAPSAYQSEGPFLTAAYESLTGVDASYFFADGDVAEWQPPFPAAQGGWNPPTGKWNIATPMQMGMFPAAALMFRRGYVERGKPVVHEERAWDDVWQRRSPLITEEGGFDPNRDAGDLPPRSAVKTGVDPLAFLVGPVEVKYGGDPANSRVTDLAPYIDARAKTVKSVTGQVRLDYGAGVCVVNAPRAQGATGFLGRAGVPIRLDDVTIESGNDYATVAAVSLDGLPLRASKKILVQVGTVARPTGWQDRDAAWTSKDGKRSYSGKEVVDTGRNPWSVVPADVRLTVKNAGLTRAVVLDANGMPARTLRLSGRPGAAALAFPADALYVVLQ